MQTIVPVSRIYGTDSSGNAVSLNCDSNGNLLNSGIIGDYPAYRKQPYSITIGAGVSTSILANIPVAGYNHCEFTVSGLDAGTPESLAITGKHEGGSLTIDNFSLSAGSADGSYSFDFDQDTMDVDKGAIANAVTFEMTLSVR